VRWIFFDLDGTLADNLSVMFEIYRDFLARHGKRATQEEFERLNGPSIDEFIPILKETHCLPGTVNELITEYQTLLDDAYRGRIQPRAEADEVLATLVEAGHRLMLVTSSHRTPAMAFVGAQRWERYFTDFVFGDDVERSKPAPDIYRLAAHRAGLRGAAPIAVEDSVNGVRAARAGGAYVIALAAYHPAEVLLGAGADRVINSLTELCELGGLMRGDAEVLHRGPIDVSWTDTNWQSPDRNAIDELWAEHPRQATLVNNPLLVMHSFARSGAGCRVVGHYLGYKNYFIGREQPLLHQGIRPVGVSGITVRQKAGGVEVLLARRSETVTAYPGWRELVPSGSLDHTARRHDGSVDVAAALLTELAEEAGLPATSVRAVTVVALIFDTVDGVYDVGCRIEVDEVDYLGASVEYGQLEWVRLAELEAVADELVPTSRALLAAATC